MSDDAPPCPSPSADPSGHALLAERLVRLPAIVEGMLENAPPVPSRACARARRFVVTGTGSSEAHARFLVHLLNHTTTRSAEFRPLSAFCLPAARTDGDSCLIVVSQGLSPNARVAIDRRPRFAHTVVFTSSTPQGARAAGKPNLARLVEKLREEGADVIHSPLEEEYSTLLRFIGPMAVYLRAWQFVRGLEPDALPPIDREALNRWLHATAPEAFVRAFLDHEENFRRGFYLVAASPLCEFAHNLAYKFLEGLFWSAPVVWDFLQFAHGPFQEVTLQPRPVVILTGSGEVEKHFAVRTREMLASASIPCLALEAATAGPQVIFEYEAQINDLVMCLIRRLGIDQRNWPSKGKDDPLYGFHRFE